MENIIKIIESHEIVLLKLFGFLGKFFCYFKCDFIRKYLFEMAR